MSGGLVVKIGGSTLGSGDTAFEDIAALALSGDIPFVVHGGGPEASLWLERMAIRSHFERGLRVTDAEVLPVVIAVFAGLVNKRIVAAISGAGATACGISGADARLLECELASPDLGFVGEPVAVHPEAVLALHAAGIIPVVASLGFVPTGDGYQLVNVNADTLAAWLADAIGARKLIYLTDVDGVRDAQSNILPALTQAQARSLIGDGTITGGMIPKVEACLEAASKGVAAQIVDGRIPHILQSLEGAGTTVSP